MPNPNILRKVVFPGAGGFLPSDIANLGFWQESDWGVTYDGSNAVSQWNDRSINAYHTSQATGAEQPTFSANEFGTKPGISFDGTDDDLVKSISDVFSGDNTGTFFFVSKVNTSENATFVWSSADEATNDYYLIIGSWEADVDDQRITIWNNYDGVTVNRIHGSTNVNDNTGHQVTIKSDGSAYDIRLDGVAETLTESLGANDGKLFDDITANKRDNITLGKWGSLSDGHKPIIIGAILYYNRELTSAEIEKVENYLKNKYGTP